MSKISSAYAVFACASLLLLPGCIRMPLKKNIVLAPTTREQNTYKTTNEHITVQANLLSKKETKRVLGTSIKDTEVIQISITNDSVVAYELKKRNIDLDLLSSRKLAKELNILNKKIKDLAIQAVCTVVSIPSFVGFVAGALTSSPALGLGSVAGGIGVAALSGRAISRSAKKAHKNTYSLLRDLSPENLTIAASSTACMLLLVDSYALPNSFNIGLCPLGTQNITHRFTVTL